MRENNQISNQKQSLNSKNLLSSNKKDEGNISDDDFYKNDTLSAQRKNNEISSPES